MKVIVTGAAGFIGFHTCQHLLQQGHEVVGIDVIDAYYDINLKYDRLAQLGIIRKQAAIPNQAAKGTGDFANFTFYRTDLKNYDALKAIFNRHTPKNVCHLAAQAGVRYSIENPRTYIDSNIIGFFNVLECCRHFGVVHLTYASSSSVYGNATTVPFKTTDNVDHPISLYAATKKSNELMAHTYSHLYGLVTTGLRFFTVYGPWGRPDMALFLFTDAIIKGTPIKVFNQGKVQRDFTYIDDIVAGVVRVILEDVTARKHTKKGYKVYNIGNNRAVQLTDFIKEIENCTGLQARRRLLPMQPGDVACTWADVESFVQDYGYRPNTPLEEGIRRFVDWYISYYKVNS